MFETLVKISCDKNRTSSEHLKFCSRYYLSKNNSTTYVDSPSLKKYSNVMQQKLELLLFVKSYESYSGIENMHQTQVFTIGQQTTKNFLPSSFKKLKKDLNNEKQSSVQIREIISRIPSRHTKCTRCCQICLK